MPHLSWSSKSEPELIQTDIVPDSLVYPRGRGYPGADVENQLIYGDNLAVMSALLKDFEGCIDLIYADPPFFTNRRYKTRVGRGEDSRHPEKWQLAKGYDDAWKNLEDYLNMLYPRLVLMHRLLSPTGSLYLHLDWHADAYVRVILDEIFGKDRLLNEIVWVYHGPSPIKSAFKRKHDTILSYTKSDDYTFNADDVRIPYKESTIKTFKSSKKAGFGKMPNLKRGKVPEDWWYFPVVARLHSERTGYPTQKPEALMERIILASSNAGEIVADFFCGSGTTPLVASRLDRKFVANDAFWRAVHTTKSRLVEGSSQPFSVKKEVKSTSSFTQLDSDRVQIDDNSVKLSPELVEELDYWEVDPDWDGNIFHSAAQAVRPRKKEQIAESLELPEESGNNRLAIRLVDIDGKHSQIEVGGN